MDFMKDTAKGLASYGNKAVRHVVGGSESTERFASSDVGAVGPKAKFKESEICFICHEGFTINALHRHHCRNCGETFCDDHSPCTDYVPSYGYAVPQRTCQKCHDTIQELQFQQRLKWRSNRVDGCFSGNLVPFDDAKEDGFGDKASRGASMALYVLSNIPGLGVIGTVATGADLVVKYGAVGIGSILLRNEIVEIADMLRSMLGDIEKMTVQDLVGGLYYLLSQRRGERGNHPLAEKDEHNIQQNKNCQPLSDELLSDLEKYASLGLLFPYLDHETNIQRLLAQQDYTLLFAQTKSYPEEPAFYVAVDNKSKTAILAIRGTDHPHDVLTDLKAKPESFNTNITLQEAMKNHMAVLEDEKIYNQQVKDAEAKKLPIPKRIYNNVGATGTCAHGGMARAALWLYREVWPTIEKLGKNGYDLVVTGHSLGAGTASLFSLYVKDKYPANKLKCYAYATPAVADATLCASSYSFITTVVLHDDIVPRATAHAARALISDILEIKDSWKPYYDQDYAAYQARVKAVWAPKTRAESNGPQYHLAKNDQLSLSPISNRKPFPIGGEKINDPTMPPRIYPLGKIVHIYFYHGNYEAVIVPHDFSSLTRIELYDSALDDHLGKNYFSAIHYVKRSRKATTKATTWVPYCNAKVCACCFCSFKWNSTGVSEAQDNFDKFNCFACGKVVCADCSQNNQALPSFNIHIPVRVW